MLYDIYMILWRGFR